MLDHDDEEIPPQPLQPQTPMYHYHERKWKQIKVIPSITNKSTNQNKKVYESIDRGTEFFELFFDGEVVDFICECSVKYGQQHGNHAFQLDRIYLKTFL